MVMALFICFFSFFLLIPKITPADSLSSFVTVVNPIRGNDFWDLNNQKPVDSVVGQLVLLKQNNINPTWLIRFDALADKEIIDLLKKEDQEKGLFLEVTTSWTTASSVRYHSSSVWHNAASAFLTGYTQEDRVKLIDSAFERFKNVFGFYPRSVGAWWIDSYSLSYMKDKYGVNAALIVADQYTTDNYQIWGQYWAMPYYPYNKNTLIPAQKLNEKLEVVVMQWAARDPLNGYGDGVQESTYSVQANDYLDFHDLDINYFNNLIDIYTKQDLNEINQIVVGLENSYSWEKYKDEYKKQIESLASKRRSGQLTILSMKDFANLYINRFPDISPSQIISASDTLGANDRVVWFMNPYYRIGWFFNKEGSVFRDIRQYVAGQEESCYQKVCEELNFATTATRVLDDVSFKQKYVIDQGIIKDFNIVRQNEKIVLSYLNEAGRERKIEFLPRDISINGTINSIDAFILKVLSEQGVKSSGQIETNQKLYNEFKTSWLEFSYSTIKFLVFLICCLIIPGYLATHRFRFESVPLNIFLSTTVGFTLLTLTAFIAGYFKSYWLVILFIVVCLVTFIYKKLYLKWQKPKFNLGLSLLILIGTFFQSLAMFRSGWVNQYGIGFYGPIGHDGIWHQALINQLLEGIPPQNPGFSGQILYNYHYFFDLLVATTARFSDISTLDLLYRFYPILFSILLGIGTYFFVKNVFKNNSASILAVYLVYFGSSFGWVVDLLNNREIGGESAFWANQPVSINLNPPFAISLLIFLAGLILFQKLVEQKSRFISLVIPLVILWGTLVEFKVYAGIVVLGGLLLLSLQSYIFSRSMEYFKVLIPTTALSVLIFFPQFRNSSQLLIFSPFWFIHSMVDFSDRVGWQRLSLARQAYFERGEWFKFFQAEVLAFVIFLVGNLGTRFLGLLTIFKINFWQNPTISLLLWISVISFVIPLFFIQKGNNWNTIQFLYYFLFILALLTAVTFINLIKRLPRMIAILLVWLIVVVTPISSLATFKNGFSNAPPSRVSLEELEALTALKKRATGVVLTYPFNKDTVNSNLKLRNNFTEPFPLLVYETTSYVAAFSRKPVYLEDEIQQDILQEDYKKRLVESNDFFNSRDFAWSENFLRQNHIRYIYLPKIFNKSLETDKLKLMTIFENKEVIIYEYAT
jgi:hypothetical protein